MSTSPVRILAHDKAALDALRQRVADATGERLTQHEVVHRLLEFALQREDQFLVAIGWDPLGADDLQAWRSHAHDMGPWTVDDIDEIVYGGDA